MSMRWMRRFHIISTDCAMRDRTITKDRSMMKDQRKLGRMTMKLSNWHVDWWAIRALIHSFVRTVHSFVCSTLLASLACSAALIRSLVWSITRSRAEFMGKRLLSMKWSADGWMADRKMADEQTMMAHGWMTDGQTDKWWTRGRQWASLHDFVILRSATEYSTAYRVIPPYRWKLSGCCC